MGRALRTSWTLDDVCRTAGWALLSACLLLAATVQPLSLPLTAGLDLFLALSLWLILRAARPFGPSDSTRQLLAEARALRATLSARLHRRPTPLLPGSDPALWFLKIALVTAVAALGAASALFLGVTPGLVGLVLVCALLLAVVLWSARLGYAWLGAVAAFGVYVLVLAQPATPVSGLGLLVTLVALAALWQRPAWALRFVLLLGGGAVILRWLYATGPVSLAAYGAPLSALLLAYAAAAPLVTPRRQAHDRELARAFLVLVFALAQGVLLLTAAFLPTAPFLALDALLPILALALGTLAWTVHDRFSHAKYFWLIGLSLVIVQMLIYLSGAAMSLVLFLMGVLALGIGVEARSLTARQAGLALLGGSLAFAVGEVVLLGTFGEHLLVGLFLGSALPAVASWYDQLALSGRERGHQKGIVAALQLAALSLLFFLILLGGSGIWQSVAWLGLGLAAFGLRPRRSPFLPLAGDWIIAAAALKLLLADSLALTAPARLELWLALLVAAVLGGMWLARRHEQRRWLHLFHR